MNEICFSIPVGDLCAVRITYITKYEYESSVLIWDDKKFHVLMFYVLSI